jgi:hypothetical protein
MEFAYRILVFSFPFILSVIAYVWLSKKTMVVENKTVRILSFLVIAAGIIFTAWQLMLSYTKALQDDGFNFKVIFFNILFMVAIAIILAFGTPDEDTGEKSRLN